MPPDDGTIGIGERFTGLERILERIELKLDKKVDLEEHIALVHRVEVIESGETPLGKFYLGQFDNMLKEVRELREHGSANAQEAIKELAQVKADLEQVKSEGSNARAVLRDKNERRDKNYKMVGIGLGILGFGDLIIGIIQVAAHH